MHPHGVFERCGVGDARAVDRVGNDEAARPILSGHGDRLGLAQAARVGIFLSQSGSGGRGEDERQIVSIPGAEAVPLDDFVSGRANAMFGEDEEVVIHCKVGGRSATALQAFVAGGHTNARHLDGGVLAWVRDVDPSLPTY